MAFANLFGRPARPAQHPALSGSYQELTQVRLPVIEKRMKEVLESRISGDYYTSHDWLDVVGKYFAERASSSFSYVKSIREQGASPSYRDQLVSVVIRSNSGRLSFDILNDRFFNPIAQVYDDNSAPALSEVCEKFLLEVALYCRSPNPADELFPFPESRFQKPRRSGVMLKM